jgi:hydrogenase-4 component B
MLGPMAALAALCVFIGTSAPLVAPLLDRALSAWAPEWSEQRRALVALAPLGWISLAAITLLAALAIFGGILARRARASVPPVVTWDCGYVQPAPTMQYTSSSFAEMLVGLFRWALRPHAHAPHLTTIFPPIEGFRSHVPEVVLDEIVLPSTRLVGRAFEWMRWIQRGSVQHYLLYILITLLLFFLLRR